MQVIIDSPDLKISCLTIGMIQNNVYIIESNNEIAICDPSCNADKIIDAIDNKNIDKILITHYHFDHIGAGYDIKNKYNTKTYASKIDTENIKHPELAPVHRKIKGFDIDEQLNDGDIINVGKSKWKVISTPGHSKGSICFYCDNMGPAPILLSGDTLFATSCGRTDFKDGSTQDMLNSLKKISKLPEDTIVLPGHGPLTTIKMEKNYMLG